MSINLFGKLNVSIYTQCKLQLGFCRKKTYVLQKRSSIECTHADFYYMWDIIPPFDGYG